MLHIVPFFIELRAVKPEISSQINDFYIFSKASFASFSDIPWGNAKNRTSMSARFTATSSIEMSFFQNIFCSSDIYPLYSFLKKN